MKNTSLNSFILMAISFFILGCHKKTQTLQEGDLLFQDLDCGELCDAIEAVTVGINGRDFSHCGMVVKVNDTLKVIEAIGNRVQINSITTFLDRSDDSEKLKNTLIARVKSDYKSLVSEATSFAVAQIGKPYDQEFLLDNGSWYCSELLYEAFKKANQDSDFFELRPMTYKDPKTDNFFPAWVRYYDDLDKEIPEGELGLNPGSISRSIKIDIINIDHI